MAIIKKTANNKFSQDVEKKEHLYTVGGNINWYSHCGRQYEVSQKKLKIELPYNPAIPTLGVYLKKIKPLSQSDVLQLNSSIQQHYSQEANNKNKPSKDE